jgi:hypothetical protein
MTSLSRIIRIDAHLPKGCATCRRWPPCAIELRTGELSRPERCPHCQRDVPIRLIRRYVGVDLELV